MARLTTSFHFLALGSKSLLIPDIDEPRRTEPGADSMKQLTSDYSALFCLHYSQVRKCRLVRCECFTKAAPDRRAKLRSCEEKSHRNFAASFRVFKFHVVNFATSPCDNDMVLLDNHIEYKISMFSAIRDICFCAAVCRSMRSEGILNGLKRKKCVSQLL